MSRLRSLRHIGLLLALVLMFLGFASASEAFRDPANLLDRTRLWTEIGIIAVPMTFIIGAGAIDLSVGSLVALSAMVAGVGFHTLHWPLPFALAAAVATGIVGGTVNGLTVSLLRVPSLVATLATLAIFRGIAMGLGYGQPISGFPSAFNDWGSLATVGQGPLAPPQQLLLLLGVVALGEMVMRKTRAGRWTVQIGENEVAARYAAVPVGAVKLGLFAASGLVCGLAAITYMARSATAHPAANAGLELQAIACVVLGGTRITGGGGSILGTFLGLLLLAMLDFGMEMMGVRQQTQTILVGLLVVVIAVFNEWLARLSERRVPATAQRTGTESAS